MCNNLLAVCKQCCTIDDDLCEDCQNAVVKCADAACGLTEDDAPAGTNWYTCKHCNYDWCGQHTNGTIAAGTFHCWDCDAKVNKRKFVPVVNTDASLAASDENKDKDKDKDRERERAPEDAARIAARDRETDNYLTLERAMDTTHRLADPTSATTLGGFQRMIDAGLCSRNEIANLVAMTGLKVDNPRAV